MLVQAGHADLPLITYTSKRTQRGHFEYETANYYPIMREVRVTRLANVPITHRIKISHLSDDPAMGLYL